MAVQKIEDFASQLFLAEQSRSMTPPLTGIDPSLTVDEAYQIQLENVKRVLAFGHTISGKKIGLTSPGIQQQLGVNEPDYGHLFAAMECRDNKVDTKVLIQPKIEGEIAFILKEDLSGGKVTSEDVMRATDYVAAAFEIVDSRVADWKIKLVDTVADNASSGRYILGEKKIRLDQIDLPRVTMTLFKNGKEVGNGTGAAVLGDPCKAVAWLSIRLFDYGVALKAGEVILSGAFSAAPEAQKGDEFEAVFSTLGSVKAVFI